MTKNERCRGTLAERIRAGGPGSYVDRIVQVAPSGAIDHRTVRKRGEHGLDT